jgi:hypothetical protein
LELPSQSKELSKSGLSNTKEFNKKYQLSTAIMKRIHSQFEVCYSGNIMQVQPTFHFFFISENKSHNIKALGNMVLQG